MTPPIGRSEEYYVVTDHFSPPLSGVEYLTKFSNLLLATNIIRVPDGPATEARQGCQTRRIIQINFTFVALAKYLEALILPSKELPLGQV